ncbi:PTS transporter subunit EIIC [Candidatus Enterococcus ferrettii]|uniref:PTS system, beta-glucoside-specific IIA component n=1 Tax=Candidatus Enterococcus ferrettii TaxID=2815324 RepID=A0ABV0EWX6_9ENTE|nr:PTS transporter subunit EIIC [Enterococcus sp. 665A]MBO1342624.1 PTS transporter subunit EIIC [Enterococcus sp. 665A]
MKKYDDLVQFIFQNVGGKNNVSSVTHCMTRLRFTLNDPEKVDEKSLLSHSEIITAQYSGGQYQVVIGTHVADVYDEVIKALGSRSSLQNQLADTEQKGLINRFIEVITKVITPTLGILIAASLVLGIQSILTIANLTGPGQGESIILNALGNALFTFFPIILGYTSAKAFKSDGFIGMMIGATLVFPSILTDLTSGEPLYTLFNHTIFATPVFKTFFGLPIIFPENGYTSTVIPIILAMFFISKIERKLTQVIPKVLRFTLVPLLTLLIGIPATMLLFGPLANFASALISAAISFLYGASPVVTGLVVGLFYQPLVLLGLHWPVIALGINNLATQGYDQLMPMIYTVPFAQMAVVFAVYLRTKSKKEKSICISAIISTVFCIIEPAMYGVTLPVKKRFFISCLASAVGGVIISAFNVPNYASTIGLFGIGGFINPANADYSGFIIAVIATFATLAVGFIFGYLTYNDTKKSEKKEETETVIAEKKLA